MNWRGDTTRRMVGAGSRVVCLLSGPQQPSRNEREAAGDAAVIALSRFHAHFREAAVTESSQPLPVDEVGTLFTNSHVRHWLYHQILCVSTYILSGKLNFSSCKVFFPTCDSHICVCEHV